MVTKEEFQKDTRFHISNADVVRLFSTRVCKYTVEEVRLADLYYFNGVDYGVVRIQDSVIYQYLLSEDTNKKDGYKKYVERCNDEHRTEDAYICLRERFQNEDYDIKKSAIVINQLLIVLDGQHRCAILMDKYGSDYRIPVVKIYYAIPLIGLRLKKFVGSLYGKIRHRHHQQI